MYRKLTALALAVTLFVSAFAFTATPADAQGQRGVLLGLVNALVQISDVDVETDLEEVQIGLVNVNRSLNNLRALNNFLNRNDIAVTVGDVSILSGNAILNEAFQDFLNANNIDIDAVVGILVLGDDLVAFIDESA